MTSNGTDALLAKWEEVYKKGLLSFWILLALQRRPAYAFEMNALIQQLSQGTISADDNSLYRALSRFEDMGLVASELQPSPSGPARRYYTLTSAGRQLLRRFQFRLRLDDARPLFTHGFCLACHGALHGLGNFHVLHLDGFDLDAPGLGRVVD